MAIIRLTEDNFENYELQANPRRQFSSSSAGVTGSVPLFVDASKSTKGLESTFRYTTGSWDDANIASIPPTIANLVTAGTTDISAAVGGYLTKVNDHPNSPLLNKQVSITRFVPGVRLDEYFLRKSTVQKSLFPYYRNVYSSLHWAYTNYNSLNFVTGGNLETNSVLIYPAATGTFNNDKWGYQGSMSVNKLVPFELLPRKSGLGNPIAPRDKFSFDFWINPRYTTEKPGDHFSAGTIFHMSSCYAVSLVTGSDIGIDGMPSGYRMMLQLSHSADVGPSSVSLTPSNNSRAYPKDLIFLSDDN